MHEIAEHDGSFIENTLDRSWSSLSRIGKRLRLYHYQSIRELQERLIIEQSAAAFRSIYLIDSSGRMYSGSFLIRDGRQYEYVRALFNGSVHYVMRHNEYDYRVDDQHESLMYAVPIEHFKVAGIEFIGMVGQTDISDIRSHMSLASFGGRGLSSVVDNKGNYIVHQTERSGIGIQENLYSELKESQFSQGGSPDQFQNELMREGRASGEYRRNGIWYCIYVERLSSVPWYLLVRVPSSVFEQQSSSFVILTIILLVAVFGCVSLISILAIKGWKGSVEAKANADAEAEFLSRMSHEIRTPLNALIGLNYLMKRDIGNKAELSRYLEKSENTSQYLLSLINDILDISKLNQEAVTLRSDAFSLPAMADSLETMMKDRMGEKRIAFSISQKLFCPVIVGDEMRLKQVVLNMLSNAAKFTPRNGHVLLSISQREPEKDLVHTEILVADDGIGMSPEFQKHIFESFSQENRLEGNDPSDAARQHGTGLGMAISWRLMKQMGGSLTVQSTLHEGSSFMAELETPVATEAQLPRPEMPPAQDRPGPDMQARLMVLVAEDNKLNSEILTTILSEEGHMVRTAENGREALDIFSASPPGTFDVILMDSQMPVMDGFSSARAIRALDRADAATVRIYACTANTSAEDRTNAYKAGMNGFVAKPINIDELRTILKGGTAQ